MARADEPTPHDEQQQQPAPGSAAELAREQQQLAEKYKRFEEVLLRMAELTAPTDPKRAALLRKAVAESKHQLIGMQLDKLAELLGQDRLSVALNSQNDVNKDLAELLDLLLTEERDKSLKDERARLKEQIRKVGELINKERQLQGQTAGGGEMRELAQGQGKVAEDARKLAEEMKPAGEKESKNGNGEKGKDDAQQGDNEKQDAADGKQGQGGDKSDDKNPGDKSSGDRGSDQSGKSGAKKPSDDNQKPGDEKGKKQDAESDGEKTDDENEKSPQDDKTPAESGQGQQSKGDKKSDKKQGQQKPNEGQPGQQGESQDGQQQDQESQKQDSSASARKRVQAAQEKMEAARQKLEKAQREGATEEQEAAIRELEQAKAELEEILRQLREEELERMLAMLEGRFRKMLQAQVEVYEGTKRVDQTPPAERDRDDEIEAGRLSRKESQIVLEAEGALAILREDGSAVAFPEAVEQMREDMELIVGRLAKGDVGDLTQGIEEDVIAALEETIESLQKAQQDMEKQKQQQAQEGEPQEPPLIDGLAELKMIRSLQMRINLRTKRLSRLVEGEVGQADKPELLEQLERLAEREESVFRVTRDIVTGKNK
ncbi:MAG TPA: hypothetical protein VHD36_06435 [Pirellulales bacterium]|nr:hypothetical protein [Pirellulales bacterium]